MKVVPRHGWGARPPKGGAPASRSPQSRRGVVFHWNGPPMNATTEAKAAAAMRAVQNWHMDGTSDTKKPWSDIAYSYGIGQTGAVYEGRGDWLQFANGKNQFGTPLGDEGDWYSVIWLGGVGEKPTSAALNSSIELVGWLRSRGAGDEVRPHSDFRRKPCPGPEFTALTSQLHRKPIPTLRDPAPATPATPVPLSPAEVVDDMHFIPEQSPDISGSPEGRTAGWLARIGSHSLIPINGAPDVPIVGMIIAVNGTTVVTQTADFDYPTYELGSVR